MENIIADDFRHGENLKLGHGIIIEPGVIVGDNVKIGHRVTLKSGTIVADNSIVDDHCITTGACYIGNNVNIRTGAIISKSTIIEDFAFIGPGVITNHTKHVPHGREESISPKQLLTYIGFGAIIGSQASILAGVFISDHVILGGGSVVIKDLLVSGVYVGAPARKIYEIPPEYDIRDKMIEIPAYNDNALISHMKKYISGLFIDKKFQ